MKGVVFNLLEEFVVTGFGVEQYETILDQCELLTEEPFIGPGTYPDADLVELATKTAQALNLSLPVALKAFGKFCFPKLCAKAPNFLEQHNHPCPFLKGVDSVIHVEVRKLYPEAVTPEFKYQERAGGLVMIYRSERKLCHFAEGLIESAGEHFSRPVSQKQTTCMHDGHDCCTFELSFATAQSTQAADELGALSCG